MEAFVGTEIRDGVGIITFFHPQSNSLPGSILRQLSGAIESAGKNNSVKVILVRSEGEKAFCAGASFDELAAIHDAEAGKTFFSGFSGVINAMRKAPKFVLVRVQGKAVGGGVGIASAGDYTFAVESAQVKLSELAIGIGPFVIGPAVERKTGVAAYAQLSINATAWQSALWAKEHGLYAEVFPDAASMDKALQDLCRQLTSSSPEAMAELKKVMWEGTEHWDKLLSERAAMSGRLVLSDFTRNAIAKFKAK
ncbi:MAG: enoyl-CoA hydratase/isomerase family protein [Bacteroidia bacterium]|nr:enoyl-CoA hydratase/isomerase family protein [Bacteroidia bacterium]